MLWREAKRIAEELNRPPDPSRPTVWLTSNGLSSDRLKAEFVRLVVMRKLGRPLDYEDCDGRPAHTSATEDLKTLLVKYKDTLATIKVLHLNDSLFYRKPEDIRQSRAKGVAGGGTPPEESFRTQTLPSCFACMHPASAASDDQ